MDSDKKRERFQETIKAYLQAEFGDDSRFMLFVSKKDGNLVQSTDMTPDEEIQLLKWWRNETGF